MLAYAATAPRHAERRSSPNAMLIVIAAHVAAIAVLMSAKMDLPQRLIFDPPPKVISIPLPKKPAPPPPPVDQTPQPTNEWISHTNPQVPTPTLPPIGDTSGTTNVDSGVITGGGTAIIPEILPRANPIKLDPQLLTPASELKPPYPHEKLLSEEEASLKLRLTIDERGRVTAVDPVGRADPAFLKAARQYLLAHWRYRPASEDGRAVTSSTVITLHFTLEG